MAASARDIAYRRLSAVLADAFEEAVDQAVAELRPRRESRYCAIQEGDSFAVSDQIRCIALSRYREDAELIAEALNKHGGANGTHQK